MNDTGLAKALTEQIIGMAMKVHRTLGVGFVEFVYRNALLTEMRKIGLEVEIEKPMQVRYENIVVGEFSVDLFINGWLIVELKAVAAIAPQHEVQMVNYLTALDQEFGLLINFGAPSLQFQRKFRRPKSAPLEPPDLHA
jgi:GxxExxY protein